MAKRARTPAQIIAEMEALKIELKESQSREAERLGSLAVKAGLHMIDASDTDLIQALREVAARFPTSAQQSGAAA